MNLPQNPAILLSYVNTQLRDNYLDLDAFCDDNDFDKNEIVLILKKIKYEYRASVNQFRLVD